MFDTATARATIRKPIRAEETNLPDPEGLRQRCLDPALRWVLHRRARLPYRAPQRLPAVARVG